MLELGLAGQSPTFRANRLGGLAGSSVARSGGAPLVVVAYQVMCGGGVIGVVAAFISLIARIVRFAGVGVVARNGGSRTGAGCPVAEDIGVVWRQSFTGGEIQVEILRHPTVTVVELAR